VFDSALLPVNFHEPLWVIKSLAGYLENFNTRRIVLIHVVSSGLESTSHAHRHLQKILAEIDADSYDIEYVVRAGNEAHEICNVAVERELEFICLPWKRKNFLQRTLQGSVSQDIIRTTNVPVFVYKTWGTPREENCLQNILYAITTDPYHEKILPYLKSEKLAAHNLYLLYVGERAPDPEAEKQRRKAVFEKLNYFKSECREYFDEVRAITTVGNPKRGIFKAARKYDAELILLGKHEQVKASEKVLGSTAERIAHKAGCSVLIIPVASTEEG